mmetsp:Transcript_64561/g.187086  ORF Transcript_64561/g.187086 Transcript_64561/m.187086 type:complete len:214 (-) Transcript_64561:115-756(-)
MNLSKARIVEMVSSGTLAPVAWCAPTRRKKPGSEANFSRAMLGTSRKSCSTPPGHGTIGQAQDKMLKRVVVHKQCIACPNSWNNVSISLNRSSAGFPSCARGKLEMFAHAGTHRSPVVGSTKDGASGMIIWCPNLPSRGNWSRNKCPTTQPAFRTSKATTSSCHTGAEGLRTNSKPNNSEYTRKHPSIVASSGKNSFNFSSSSWSSSRLSRSM